MTTSSNPAPSRDVNGALHAPPGMIGGQFVTDPQAEPRLGGRASQLSGDGRTPAPGLIPLTPAAESVLQAIRDAGGRPLIVGGSVRDALLAESSGMPIEFKDIDIEVYGISSHDTLISALQGLGHVDERGTAFGVVAATVAGEDFDISLPRRDSKTGEGHQGFTVEFDPDISERDACGRRDFTINALAWDPDTGELVDHFGGQADLDAGILRHTTEAFVEDPLRVLRGAQFAARFGFEMAPETSELSASIADRFPELSTERVWGEWRKIASRGLHITSALRVLEDTGWIQHFPELAATRGVAQDALWHAEGDVFTHIGLAADEAAQAAERAHLTPAEREIAVLGALVHDFGKVTHTQATADGRITSQGHDEAGERPARDFLSRIGAGQAMADKIGPLVAEHMCHISSEADRPSSTAVRRLIRRLNRDGTGPTIYDWARVVDADCAGRGTSAKPSPASKWLEVAEHVGPTPRKSLLLGTHLAAAGYQPSPGWSWVIEAAVDAQDRGEFDDEAGAVEWFAKSGLVPVGFPQRPSNRDWSKTQKWLRANDPDRASNSPQRSTPKNRLPAHQ